MSRWTPTRPNCSVFRRVQGCWRCCRTSRHSGKTWPRLAIPRSGPSSASHVRLTRLEPALCRQFVGGPSPRSRSLACAPPAVPRPPPRPSDVVRTCNGLDCGPLLVVRRQHVGLRRRNMRPAQVTGCLSEHTLQLSRPLFAIPCHDSPPRQGNFARCWSVTALWWPATKLGR